MGQSTDAVGPSGTELAERMTAIRQRVQNTGADAAATIRQYRGSACEEASMSDHQIDWLQCPIVEMVPGRVSGTPVLRDTRLTVDAILTNFDAGLEPDQIADVFDVPVGSVRTILEFREAAEIINRVTEWAGSEVTALAWYRSQPLPGFGDQTAEELVKSGRAAAVKRYLADIANGGYT